MRQRSRRGRRSSSSCDGREKRAPREGEDQTLAALFLAMWGSDKAAPEDEDSVGEEAEQSSEEKIELALAAIAIMEHGWIQNVFGDTTGTVFDALNLYIDREKQRAADGPAAPAQSGSLDDGGA